MFSHAAHSRGIQSTTSSPNQKKTGPRMITIRRNHIATMRSHPGDHAVAKNRRNLVATALVLTTAIASIPSMASAIADGALDTTFGTGGKVTTAVGVGDEGKAIAIQSNGKILVVGNDMADFEVVRYNTDGSLDTTFDTDGKVTTDIGTSTTDSANAVAIQSDGKIVATGSSGSSTDFAVVRYTTTGTLDTTFDTDGKQTTDIGTSTSDTGSAVAIQSDSKIVVAGRISVSGPPVFAVARYEVTATSPSSSSTSSTSTTVAVATATSPTTTAVVSGTSTATGNMSSTTLPETGSSSPMPGIIGAILVAVGLALEARRRLTPIP